SDGVAVDRAAVGVQALEEELAEAYPHPDAVEVALVVNVPGPGQDVAEPTLRRGRHVPRAVHVAAHEAVREPHGRGQHRPRPRPPPPAGRGPTAPRGTGRTGGPPPVSLPGPAAAATARRSCCCRSAGRWGSGGSRPTPRKATSPSGPATPRGPTAATCGGPP